MLDAGCGAGRDLPVLAARGGAVGLDLSPGLLARARQAASGARVQLAVADVRRVPLRDASVAAAWACAVLVHLDAGDRLLAMRELGRVTVPGGPVAVSLREEPEGGWRRQGEVPAARYYAAASPGDAVQEMRAAGLVGVSAGPPRDAWFTVTGRAP